MDRQIRHQHLKLTISLGRVGLGEPLVQLGKIDVTISGGNPQPVGDSLPI